MVASRPVPFNGKHEYDLSYSLLGFPLRGVSDIVTGEIMGCEIF
jgi:hypothetical protein